MDVLDALSAVRERRQALDALELELIEQARESGVPWSRIAPALGVASRQAAEQRFLRLSGAAGERDPGLARRQRSVDTAGLKSLRRAVRQALADDSWAGPGRASLARTSLELAVSAPAGALFALVEAALDDLAGVERPAMVALRAAHSAARP